MDSLFAIAIYKAVIFIKIVFLYATIAVVLPLQGVVTVSEALDEIASLSIEE